MGGAQFLPQGRRELVPNMLYTLRQKGIWDIIYEHRSYFWSSSLARLFGECRFRVHHVRDAYKGQFLCIEASPHPDVYHTTFDEPKELGRVAEEVSAFGETFRTATGAVRGILDRLKTCRQRAVIWGAGSKGVTFLNVFKHYDMFEYAVDINPHKQGKYVPGTGQRIVSPDLLREYQPAAVFVMNPIYQDEIAQRISDLSLRTDLVTV